jgi:phosphonate transport system ATP-binding protein
MKLLKTHKLGLSRNGKWLFRNLNITIQSGSLVAILGPSGVGKSSLLSCLSGSETQTEGKVEFEVKSDNIRTPENISPDLGIIFQSLRLTEHVTVLENVLYGKIAQYGIKQSILGFPAKDRELAYQILKDLGIAHLAHKWTSQTSGGEKQRTAIARTLFQNPKIILADEPVSNLDTYYSGRVMGLLRNLASHDGKIILTALHDPQLISRFADFALSLNPEQPEGWNLRAINPRV